MAKIPYTVQKTQSIDIELEEIEIIDLAIHVIQKTFDITPTSYIDGKNIIHTKNEGLFVHNVKYRKANKKDKDIIELRDKLRKIKSKIWEKNK